MEVESNVCWLTLTEIEWDILELKKAGNGPIWLTLIDSDEQMMAMIHKTWYKLINFDLGPPRMAGVSRCW